MYSLLLFIIYYILASLAACFPSYSWLESSIYEWCVTYNSDVQGHASPCHFSNLRVYQYQLSLPMQPKGNLHLIINCVLLLLCVVFFLFCFQFLWDSDCLYCLCDSFSKCLFGVCMEWLLTNYWSITAIVVD